jgi:glycosyltransferase involved in cell wall biosynthesis
MIKLLLVTTDNREHRGRYDMPEPWLSSPVLSLVSGFEQFSNDIEVHIVSCTKQSMSAPEKLADNVYFHQPIVPKIGWGRSLFLGCAYAVRKLARRIGADIVHGQGTERDSAMAAVLSGYPNVLTIHGNMRVHASRAETRSLYYSIAARLETYALSRTDGLVAISKYTEDLVKDLVPRTWLLPNAAELRYFGIQPTPPLVPRILFIGAINERKNPLGLIKACEPLLLADRCTLAIAGPSSPGTPYAHEVQRLANEIPGIEMLGFLAGEDLPQQYRNASLFVLPTFEDNCPMVVLEAMAAGVPVVASRIGGIPDLIRDGETGLLFDPNDTADLRRQVERIATDPELRSRLGANGQAEALRRFHPKVVAKAHIEAYRDVLRRTRAS